MLIGGYAYIYQKYNVGFPCIINKTFGIYCSGCGLTRAGCALFNLDFYQAFRYNAFSFILIPLLFMIFIDVFCEYVFGKSIFISKIPNWFWIVLFVMFCSYGVIRNFVPYLQPLRV